MDYDLDQLHADMLAYYRKEHEVLGEKGTLDLLERGRQWDLAPVLQAGGVLVFPHVGVKDCGHQIASVVHACLDSGAERVLVISVLHSFTDEMEQARRRVAAGEDPSQFACWGIQGPGLPGRQEYLSDHVLMSWHHLWDAEVKRRGIRGPEKVERYPYLAGGHPEKLPGIEEIARLAENAVIVSTADAFHHGIGYGDTPENSYYPHAGGLDLARRRIEEGMQLLGSGDYWGYNQHCVTAKSDHRDAGQVFRYVRGPLKGEIVDLTYSDADEVYESEKPTWVAAALTAWLPVKG